MKLKALSSVLLCLLFCSYSGGKVPPDRSIEKIEIAIDAPATNYQIKIVEIRKVKGEYWVLSEVSKVGEIGGAAITKIRDTVLLEKTGASVPQKHFVAGKSWGWAEPNTVTYLAKGEKMTDEKWKEGEVVWTRPKRKKEG